MAGDIWPCRRLPSVCKAKQGSTGTIRRGGRSCWDWGKPPQRQSRASELNPPPAARDQQRFLSCVYFHLKPQRFKEASEHLQCSQSFVLFGETQSKSAASSGTLDLVACGMGAEDVGLPQRQWPQLQPPPAGSARAAPCKPQPLGNCFLLQAPK